ncbi:MAG TPA: DinB family protein [Acidimicrobiales bacterium]|nr:DinB family protein [Acidimicrobiales bacterium]
MVDVLGSLSRRIAAMHSLYVDAMATMTLEQVNHVERDGVLPIAFSLFHLVQLEDGSVTMLGGPRLVYDDEWAGRIRPAVADHGKERSVEEMTRQRIGDYQAFAAYTRHVFAKTEAWLAEIDEGVLDEIVVARPFPPQIASTFSARVAGEAGLSRLEAVECWIYQHGLRHMGEIEHARALVGLGGMTS